LILGDRQTGKTAIAIDTILNQRGTTLWNMGKLELSIESYAEALVIYRAIGMQRHEARALNNMGIVFAALGEYEEALAHYKSALKLDQALGERSGANPAEAAAAWLAVLDLDPDDAAACAAAASWRA